MSEKEKNYYTENVERYCHIIGKNTTVSRISGQSDSCFECSNRHICEKSGGCKNASFNVSGEDGIV